MVAIYDKKQGDYYRWYNVWPNERKVIPVFDNEDEAWEALAARYNMQGMSISKKQFKIVPVVFPDSKVKEMINDFLDKVKK